MHEVLDRLSGWSLEPVLAFGLALTIGLYAVGWRRLRRRNAVRPEPWRASYFVGGMSALVLALFSPIATLDGVLFSAHMVQHLLLVQVAVPLIWLGAPLLPILWALPPRRRRAIGRLFIPGNPVHDTCHVLTKAPLAALLHLGALAIWHVPSFYDAAQGPSLIHQLEHTTFVATALLYWWPVVHPTGGRRRLGYGAAILYLFPLLLLENLIGALLTFADRPLYATYRQDSQLWGLDPLSDQQLAGLIMWIPGGLLVMLAVFVLLTMLLRQEEERDVAHDGPPAPRELLTGPRR